MSWIDREPQVAYSGGLVSSDTPSTRPLQPMIDASPAACAEIRRALDIALATFRRWNIEPPPGGWIQDAAAWLDRVVELNSLGETAHELARTSAASALAVDLYHIATCLGEEANTRVAAELATLARGQLMGRGGSAPGRDFLVQFWVGALLAQSKLEPHIIAYDVQGQPKPDFVINKGGTRFAIEVKRPRTPHSARRIVQDAAGQLRAFGGPGIIMIDASECMSIGPFDVICPTADAREAVRSDLRVLHRSLHDVATSYTRSGKFSHICMLLSFVRYWNWEVSSEGARRRDAGILLNANSFGYLWSRQVTHLTHEIMDSLREGIRQLTGNPPVFTYS
jgi:hypothetical protein